MTNSTTYKDGPWQFALPDGTKTLDLKKVESLRDWGVTVPADDPSFEGYPYEPENACMAACVVQLGDGCQQFTYDGITKDRRAFQPIAHSSSSTACLDLVKMRAAGLHAWTATRRMHACSPCKAN
jgi:hypothetical protein